MGMGVGHGRHGSGIWKGVRRPEGSYPSLTLRAWAWGMEGGEGSCSSLTLGGWEEESPLVFGCAHIVFV